ncbi:ras association domain-containing protein 5-like isoform X1 [Anguilla rostrata]|uniref:ras association domain-containing protein 5-like isoform X1 n=1 Tax=Anguilla rostrata TaxID=7938 RepID=UPI0030CF0A8D
MSLVGRGSVELLGQHGTGYRSQIAAGIMPGRPMDCFRTVSKRIGRLFRRLPKSRSWSDNLKLIDTPSKSYSLTLSDSSYPCLLECPGLVQKDINWNDGQTEDAPPPGTCSVNDQGTDGPHNGIIEVHLKLRRPISVETDGGSSDSSAVSKLQAEEVKRIHVSSSTTVQEVIQGLLGKFSAQNDPSRFTLYRQTHRDGQDVLQKLSLSEHPLCLRKGAQPEPDSKPLTFELRENDAAGVEWYAFSVPELQNFLTILTKEEELRVRQVERRYKQYREKLCQVLQEAQGKPG